MADNRGRAMQEERARPGTAAFTLAAVIARAGASVTPVRTWEVGRQPPRVAKRIANALGATVSELGFDDASHTGERPPAAPTSPTALTTAKNAVAAEAPHERTSP